MITKASSLSVTSLRVAGIESRDARGGNSSAPHCKFNELSDIILTPSLTKIAVEIGFHNERLFVFDSTHGIRRRISVALVNRTLNSVESKTSFTALLSRSTLCRSYTVELPVNYDSIVDVCEFEIVVRDENNRKVLSRREIRFFDLALKDTPPTKLYSVSSACLHTGGSNPVQAILSCRPDDYTCLLVRFVATRLITYRYECLPELEICIRFADGSSHTCFSRPFPVGDPDGLTVAVDARILITPQNRGICYAELRCFSRPIAGMVFSTSGPEALGEWTDAREELNQMVEYTPALAAQRFQSLIENHLDDIIENTSGAGNEEETESESESDYDGLEAEDFDKLLDDFISSSLTDCGSSDSESDAENDPDNPDSEETADDGEQERLDDEKHDEDNEEISEQPADFLSALTGLESVKAKLDTYSKVVRFMAMRSRSGLPAPDFPLHSMFLGSPGTGKTTVAKAMGRMLADAGILSKGHVVVRERATLLGQFYSSESENTLKALEEARGGILLIDEAYQLYQPNDPRDPGKFVIETLLTALADEDNRDWMLILAGYPAPMMKMFEINPGLKSRIPDSNIYTFDDFSETQLMEIATRYLTANGFSLSDCAAEALTARLHADYESRDATFGNARHVINLIQTGILPAMAVRLDSCTAPDERLLSVIEPTDIPSAGPLPVASHRRVGFDI